MPLILSAFAAGLVFGLGLVISQMVNPAKVIGFLDIFGDWDPSLAFVMGGAVLVSAVGFAFARHRGYPVLAGRLEIPTRQDCDTRLITGSAIFGIGWGLAGLCPGPALVGLSFGPWQVSVFVVSMIAGMALFRILPTNWPQVSFQKEARGVDG